MFEIPPIDGAALETEADARVLRQVVRRWLVALAKSVRKERMVENLDVFYFQLAEADLALIATLETGQSGFFSHRDPAIVKWMSERKLGI